jgi:hypothetical protein
MKKTAIFLSALLCSSAWADVAVVNIWSALPGKGPQLFQNGMEAKAIHEKLGATVSIASDQDGNMHYVVLFDSWETLGKFQDSAATNEEWQAFWQRVSMEPTADLLRSYLIDNPVVAKAQNASMVYSWDVDQGKTPAFVALSEEARKIHERLGASIGINIDELGDVHYEMTFANWEAWGNFQMRVAADEEWNQFWTRANQEPMAELLRVWRINAVQ